MLELDEKNKLKIRNVQILKRTFEGVNDDPIRSKYYPSKKYAVAYDIDGYEHNPCVHCFISKKDSEYFIEQLKQTHYVF